jgi:hypothetical protein
MTTMPSLVRAELTRLTRRRAVRNLALACIVFFGLASIAAFVYTQRLPASAITHAHQEFDNSVRQAQLQYEKCIAALPAGQTNLSECGAPIDAQTSDLGDFTQFFTVQPFLRGIIVPALARIIGLAAATAAFFIGAASAGGDWRNGYWGLQATWENRRLRLLAAKGTALVAAAAALAATVQAAWLGSALLILMFRGTNSAADPWNWSVLISEQMRLVVLAMLASLIAFGIASLFRSTVAVIGLAFGYALCVEGALRWVSPEWQRWFISDNVIAAVTPGGLRTSWYTDADLHLLRISNIQALSGVAVIAALLVLAAGITLRTRDLP